MDIAAYNRALRAHYEKTWGVEGKLEVLEIGSKYAVLDSFCVLRFAPRAGRNRFTYATVGMSADRSRGRVELHLHAPRADVRLVELLCGIAHHHMTVALLDLHHVVHFDRPWLPESSCVNGYITHPYLDGPALETPPPPGPDTRCLWVIPVTESEKAYALEKGVQALETAFEEAALDHADPTRPSVIK
jgi:hypothetical protein